jgi:hypothetical protein
MIRRLVILAFALSLLLSMATAALLLRSYADDLWIQTSPPGTVYAFKVRGSEATVYRLDQKKPYPNRRAAIVAFSLNYVVSISTLISLISGVYLIRPRRKPAGFCQTCGYDLRASNACCPECGTPIAPKATA